MRKLILGAVASIAVVLAGTAPSAHENSSASQAASDSLLTARMSVPPARFQTASLECSDAFVGGSCRTKRTCYRGCEAIYDVEMTICVFFGGSGYAVCIAAAGSAFNQCRKDCDEEFPF